MRSKYPDPKKESRAVRANFFKRNLLVTESVNHILLLVKNRPLYMDALEDALHMIVNEGLLDSIPRGNLDELIENISFPRLPKEFIFECVRFFSFSDGVKDGYGDGYMFNTACRYIANNENEFTVLPLWLVHKIKEAEAHSLKTYNPHLFVTMHLILTNACVEPSYYISLGYYLRLTCPDARFRSAAIRILYEQIDNGWVFTDDEKETISNRLFWNLDDIDNDDRFMNNDDKSFEIENLNKVLRLLRTPNTEHAIDIALSNLEYLSMQA